MMLLGKLIEFTLNLSLSCVIFNPKSIIIVYVWIELAHGGKISHLGVVDKVTLEKHGLN